MNEFSEGDRVRISEGIFAGKTGEVTQAKNSEGLVNVEIEVFGRRVAIDLEPWQIEAM